MSWINSTLGDEFELYQPKTLAKNELVESGKYPVYGANGVIGFHNEYNHADPQVLITCRGATCGTINLSTANAWINGNAMVVKPKSSNVDLNFLKHYLVAGIDLTIAITGAAQPQITRQSLSPIKIKLPPLAEQKRIAAILDKADEIRRKREQAIAKLDQLAQSIFVEMFGDVGMNWPSTELGDVCDVRDGTHDSPKFVENGFPLITSKNLVNGSIDKLNVSYISEDDYNNIAKRSKVDFGDILMAMIGTIGNPIIVYDKSPQFAIKNVALIKFVNNSPDRIFIKSLLQTQIFTNYTARISRGGTQKFLSLGDIRKFTFPLPPLALQEEFANRIEKLEQVKAENVEALDRHNQLFASLQHQVFTTGFSG